MSMRHPLSNVVTVALLCGALCSAQECVSGTNAPATPASELPVADTNAPADIHAAAKSGDLDALKRFLAADPAQINARTRLRDTPLHWAASCKQLKTAQYLIDAGADVNAHNLTGQTPLHLAAFNGDLEMIKLLLAGKADINAKADAPEDEEANAETPLHIAVARCKPELIEFMLENKADPGALTKGGESATDVARKRGRADVMRLLRKHHAPGADDE